MLVNVGMGTPNVNYVGPYFAFTVEEAWGERPCKGVAGAYVAHTPGGAALCNAASLMRITGRCYTHNPTTCAWLALLAPLLHSFRLEPGKCPKCGWRGGTSCRAACTVVCQRNQALRCVCTPTTAGFAPFSSSVPRDVCILISIGRPARRNSSATCQGPHCRRAGTCWQPGGSAEGGVPHIIAAGIAHPTG